MSDTLFQSFVRLLQPLLVATAQVTAQLIGTVGPKPLLAGLLVLLLVLLLSARALVLSKSKLL